MVEMIGMPAKAIKRKAKSPKSVFGKKIEIFTAEEVSLRLRLPLSTVYYLAKTGALPGCQLGRSWRFFSNELDRLAQSKPAKPRILVADEDAETRQFVKELLASRNCTVVEAGNVVEALAAVRRRRFDLFLVDFQLPGENGIEFIRQIGDDYSLTRVVVTMAFADLAQADQLFGLGAMTLLRKPLDAGQLIECVDRILGANQPGNNFIEAEKVARQGRRPASISAHLNQSLQSLESVADADR